MCNRECLWNYNSHCVSESIEEIGDDITFETDECIGFLREDMEQHKIDMKSRLMAYCPEGENGNEMADYIYNMSYVDTLKMYNQVFGDREE